MTQTHFTERLDPTRGYGDEPAPLLGRGVITAAFFATAATAAATGRRAGVRLPERIQGRDLAMIGVATYKLARLMAKDRVTTFVRAPFTEYQHPAGRGEVEERPRGTGLRRAVGELMVCPFCLDFWVASGFVAGIVAWPRQTRLVATVFDVLAVSDALQLADRAAQDRLSS
jgi:hypothetical protein